MRLYVANVTHQTREFYYRRNFLPEGASFLRTNNARRVTIEAGRQVAIEGDLDLEQAQTIMDQLAIYGGIGVEELARVPLKKITYLMSYGKEIPVRVIHMASEHNNQLMTNEGDVRRRNAAVAAHPVVERHIQGLRRFDIEMLEVPPGRNDPPPVGDPLDFGAHIDPTAVRAANIPKEQRGRPNMSRKRARR